MRIWSACAYACVYAWQPKPPGPAPCKNPNLDNLISTANL